MHSRLLRSLRSRATAIATASGMLLTLVVGAPLPAHAALSRVGPIDATTLPNWYDDGVGTRLQLCVDASPPCFTSRPDLAAEPSATNLNAEGEVFWYNAEADIARPGGPLTFMRLAVEGTFSGGVPGQPAADQASFARVRFRVFDLIPGASYTITYPYGTKTFTADALGRINDTQDVGCFPAGVPCADMPPGAGFDAALAGGVGAFLSWDPAVAPAAPAGYIGSFGTPHKVIGSPLGQNFFRVAGPNIGGPGVNVVQTDLLDLAGKLAFSVPGAPTGLTASAGPGGGQISLSWTAPADDGGTPVTGYRVFRGTSATTLAPVGTVAAGTTTFTDSALGNGTTRFYAVSALNRVGESIQSAATSATTFVAPSVPRSVTAAAGPNAGDISVNWTAPLDNGSGPLSGYRVYRGTASGALSAIADVAASTTTFTDTGLGNGATRFYAVTALNVAGESVRSNEASATTFNTPGAPRTASATAGPGRGQITVTWAAPLTNGGSAVTGYRVYGGNASGALSLLTTVGATTTSFSESALADGATRFYAITALNAVGEGLRSNEATGRTFSLASAPQALAVTRGPGAGELSLSWSPPANNGGGTLSAYRIYRGTASGALTALTDVSGTTTSFTDTGLPEGATRFYAVTAINPVGESTRSGEVSGITFARPSVTNNVVTAAGPGAGQLTVSWNPPTTDGGTAVTGYRIYRGTSATTLTALTDVIGSARSFTDSGLGAGTTRFYAIAALNAVGEGTQSAASAATTFNVASAPANPNAASGPNTGQITLTWSAPVSNGGSAITGYRIYRGTASGALTPLTDVTASVTSFTDSGLGNNARRFYAISAINVAGEGARTSELTATTFGTPLAPTSFSVTAGANAGEITLQWAAPSSDGGNAISAYHVYRGTTNTALSFIADLAGSARSFTDSSLPENSQRFYAVSASNSVGEGPRTAVTSATTFARPSVPQNVTATAGPANGQITVGWAVPATNGGTAVTGYRIYRGTTSGSLLAVADVAATARSFTDTGLPENTLHFYAVSAINGVGEGVRSTEVSALSMGRPSAPAASIVSGPNAGQLTLSWTPPATDGGRAITKYRVYRGTTAGTLVALADLPATATGFLDSGLGSNTTRFYAVSAFNSSGEGALSAVVSGTTFSGPSAPQHLRTAPGLIPGTVAVIWDAPASDGGRPLTSYKVFRATETGAFSLVATLPATQKQFSDSGLNFLSNYRYRVVATNSVGDGTAAEVCTRLFPLSLVLGTVC
jgi:fibronectin type 3 domain-containing protein